MIIITQLLTIAGIELLGQLKKKQAAIQVEILVEIQPEAAGAAVERESQCSCTILLSE